MRTELSTQELSLRETDNWSVRRGLLVNSLFTKQKRYRIGRTRISKLDTSQEIYYNRKAQVKLFVKICPLFDLSQAHLFLSFLQSLLQDFADLDKQPEEAVADHKVVDR